ncbi:MAG: hydroxymethylbilane synthase [Aquificota bacterium]|nr:MAG: hydroxymethylbilane synthase [Aquificota bacterium]
MNIRIGTRGSKLALWQANHVREMIEALSPEHHVDLVVIKTKGDKILDAPLAKVGGKGLFVKEIEEALLEGRVDMAVHSMKDVPTELPHGLEIGAIPKREEPWDLLVAKEEAHLSSLPQGAKVGTSSLRRKAQLLAKRPDLEIRPLRGNLDTRFRKLKETDLDAIVVALAGVKRLGINSLPMRVLSPQECLPAIGQGALALEVRQGEMREILEALHHPETEACVKAERAFLAHIGGSCQIPVAAIGKVEGEEIILQGLIASPDGRDIYRGEKRGPTTQAQNLGLELAQILLEQGGRRIIEAILGG